MTLWLIMDVLLSIKKVHNTMIIKDSSFTYHTHYKPEIEIILRNDMYDSIYFSVI